MAAIVKVKTTAQRGSRWLKKRFNGGRGSRTSTETHNLCIVSLFSVVARGNASEQNSKGPPTNFRREELTLESDADG